MGPMGGDFRSLLFPEPAANPTQTRGEAETCPTRPNTPLGATNAPLSEVWVLTSARPPSPIRAEGTEADPASENRHSPDPDRNPPDPGRTRMVSPSGRHSRGAAGAIPVERFIGRLTESGSERAPSAGRHAVARDDFLGSADGAA